MARMTFGRRRRIKLALAIAQDHQKLSATQREGAALLRAAARRIPDKHEPTTTPSIRDHLENAAATLEAQAEGLFPAPTPE